MKTLAISSLIGFAVLVLSPLATFAQTVPALSASCTGSSSTTQITWASSVTGGIAPYTLLWGDGTTGTSDVVSYAPGTYSTSLKVTDASSTVATTTCSATVTGTTTPTTTVANLLAEIASLEAQLRALLGSQSGSGTTITPPGNNGDNNGNGRSCSIFTRDLFKGDHGSDVSALQQFLAQYPSIYPQGSVTGFFGPDTEIAVIRYQQQNGIPATGYFGPLSRNFYHIHCDAGAPGEGDNPNFSTTTPNFFFSSTTATTTNGDWFNHEPFGNLWNSASTTGTTSNDFWKNMYPQDKHD